MRAIKLWQSTNRAIILFLVLPGSLFSITEIPEYTYFSPSKKPTCKLKHKSEENVVRLAFTPPTAMKFRPKFFWKWSFFDQNQQPLQSVEPFERNRRALFISQCPYEFFLFLDVRNASNKQVPTVFTWFPTVSILFSLASPRNLPSWAKYYGKFERFGKEFRRTKFIAEEFLRWGWVFSKSRLQNDVRRFGRDLTGLFSQQILLNLIKRCSNQHAEIFINETNMRRFENVFRNRISSSWHQKSKISKRIVLIDNKS